MTKQARQGNEACQILENSQASALSSQNGSKPRVLGLAALPTPPPSDAHALISTLSLCPAAPVAPGGWEGGGRDCRWNVQVPRAAAELVAGPRVRRAQAWPPGTGAPRWDPSFTAARPHLAGSKRGPSTKTPPHTHTQRREYGPLGLGSVGEGGAEALVTSRDGIPQCKSLRIELGGSLLHKEG